jgi:hypothetical protein
MSDITVEIDLKSFETMPQLIVISAITEGRGWGGQFIENHCCMVRTTEDLTAEVAGWQEELEQAGYLIVKAVVRVVPRSVYMPEKIASLNSSPPGITDAQARQLAK